MKEQSDKTQVYEIAFLLKTGATDEQLAATLANFGATVVNKGPVSQIQLAYTIKKQKSAQFSFWHFTLTDANKMKELANALNLLDSVIRSLVTKVIPPKEKTRGKKEEKKEVSAPVSQLDSLSNESLEKQLEEILK